ncbi:Secreted protein OS=Streptomyces griseomycini OX=66895 GN=FHS37_000552 PE=4 SV=1 [Streptomyces griseomycini]
MTRRTVVLFLAALLPLLAGAGQARATGYRYWSFWERDGGTWTYATQGPSLVRPADGAVQGFRFSVSEDSADAAKPRGSADCRRGLRRDPAAGRHDARGPGSTSARPPPPPPADPAARAARPARRSPRTRRRPRPSAAVPGPCDDARALRARSGGTRRRVAQRFGPQPAPAVMEKDSRRTGRPGPAEGLAADPAPGGDLGSAVVWPNTAWSAPVRGGWTGCRPGAAPALAPRRR